MNLLNKFIRLVMVIKSLVSLGEKAMWSRSRSDSGEIFIHGEKLYPSSQHLCWEFSPPIDKWALGACLRWPFIGHLSSGTQIRNLHQNVIMKRFLY